MKPAIITILSLLLLAIAKISFAAPPTIESVKEFSLNGRVTIQFDRSLLLWNDVFAPVQERSEVEKIRQGLKEKRRLTLLSDVYANAQQNIVLALAQGNDGVFYVLVFEETGSHSYNISDIKPRQLRSVDPGGNYSDLLVTVH